MNDASTPPMADLQIYTLEQQIACVSREVERRKRCYPQLVKERHLLQANADQELGAMRAALTTLKNLKENPSA